MISNIAKVIGDAIGRFVGEKVARATIEAMNPAQLLQTKLGVREPEAFSKRQHRYATPERKAVGRKAGAYGRGLRNWCNQQPSKGRI